MATVHSNTSRIIFLLVFKSDSIFLINAYACIEPFLYFHKWLELNKGQMSTEISNNPHTLGHRTEMTFVDWLHGTQPLATWFNNYMGGYRFGRPAWMDVEVYPVKET